MAWTEAGRAPGLCSPGRRRLQPGAGTGPRPRRSAEGRARDRVLPALGGELFRRHGQRRRAERARGAGPGHVAGLDRGQRPLLGWDDGHHLRGLRLAQDHHLLSQAGLPSGQPLGESWPGQRAVFRGGQGARSRAVRSLPGRAPGELRARSLRRRKRLSGREDRLPRAGLQTGHPSCGRLKAAGRHALGLLLRLSDRGRGSAPLPQSGVRRRRGQALGSEALL